MSNLSKKEINEVLNELKNVRPEQLTGEAKRLFEAIMKIADERDELLKERQADKEKIKELEDKLNEEAYIRVSAGAHNRICELEKENKRLYEENQIYALEGSRVRLQIHIEKNYIPKVKVIEALQDIEDYFDRLNVPDEDIEFIQSIEEKLLKDGGE